MTKAFSCFTLGFLTSVDEDISLGYAPLQFSFFIGVCSLRFQAVPVYKSVLPKALSSFLILFSLTLSLRQLGVFCGLNIDGVKGFSVQFSTFVIESRFTLKHM